jgi:hypothetical protein
VSYSSPCLIIQPTYCTFDTGREFASFRRKQHNGGGTCGGYPGADKLKKTDGKQIAGVQNERNNLRRELGQKTTKKLRIASENASLTR